MTSFFDCTGPSIQLFNDQDNQEQFVIAYGPSTPPAVPLGFKMEFKYARVLSGNRLKKITGEKFGIEVVDLQAMVFSSYDYEL